MIIFLYGADTFRSRQKLKELKDKFIREIDRSGLNLNQINSESFELAELENSLSAAPFMAKKRMVVVEEIISKNIGKKTQKDILELIKSKNSDSVIIIFWEGEITKKTAASNLLYKNLSLEKYCYKFDRLQGAQLKNWYQKKVGETKSKITPACLNLLSDIIGGDLWRANAEINKLAAYCRNREITEPDIKLHIKSQLEENIFNLTDALGQKNKKLALRLINDQIKSGAKDIELLNSIIWHFKNLLLAKSIELEEPNAKISSWALSSQLKLHPFVAKKVLGQIRNFDFAELKAIYKKLLNAEIKIKTSQANVEIMLDLLFV